MDKFINLPSMIYLIITVFWLGEFVVFPENLKKKEGKGKKTFYIILVTILLNIIFSIFLFLKKVGNISGDFTIIIRYLGLIIYFAGLVIRYYSVILLGQSFTRNVAISKEEELVSNGLYTILRHPLYLGLLLLVVGAVTYIGNLIWCSSKYVCCNK